MQACFKIAQAQACSGFEIAQAKAHSGVEIMQAQACSAVMTVRRDSTDAQQMIYNMAFSSSHSRILSLSKQLFANASLRMRTSVLHGSSFVVPGTHAAAELRTNC